MAPPKEDISNIVSTVELYLKRERVLPASIDELARERYLDQVPKDPWGRKYYFSIERPEVADKDMPFYVWSLGRDGAAGGAGFDADVGNWDPPEPPDPWWKFW